MKIEVDQSGRIEMAGDTVIAAADGFVVTVRVRAEVKMTVRDALKQRGVKTRMIMIRMFVGGIVMALQDNLRTIDSLTIDEEYIGYEAEIKSLLIDRLRSLDLQLDPHLITVARVGKKSPAHHAAIRVTRKQVQADLTPTATELLEMC
ncbi:MAG: hypothetical protein KDI07_17250 [Anaerolineae bacterium]|nr:hypothetical protein [Anaerolineae bacterium]MCB0234175.1 hypothetical protein [Anaerolineae bacterium]MCB0250324.1 hypothetical protein [Anaerolineae bacterium]MCB9141452.1 hypothetical protein [Anaerolineales bacterium]MCO5245332.1 hypothetical protein [Anaerolineae bacterium]